MSEQIGWRGLLNALRAEAPNYAVLLPQLPRLLHQYLNPSAVPIDKLLREVLEQQKRYNTLLALVCLLLGICVLLLGIFAWQVLIVASA